MINVDFAQALIALRKGARVRREAWDERAKLYLERVADVPPVLYQAHGREVVVWKPTQIDILAEDWEIL